MIRGLYTAAFGMINSQAKQDVSANNIANTETPGFKQDKLVSKTFPEVMLQNMDNNNGGEPKVQQLGSMPFGVETDGTYTDFSQGILDDTGSDLDFAINGEGLFGVQYFNGDTLETGYLRSGNFTLDSNGMLVTQDGGFVLGRDLSTGQTGPIRIGSGKVSVDSQGNMSIDSQLKYSLNIYNFDNYDILQKLGNNMYKVKDNNAVPRVAQYGEYTISQGKLEQSNVDITGEIVNMIANLRSYQANQRVLQSIDQTLGKTVNEVGSLK